ncbi:MAG: hypothetical protein KDA86_16160 [Planctomycetaceae bacterium]|nr:hypothetical protein [Planctomycetaceae bacterium]
MSVRFEQRHLGIRRDDVGSGNLTIRSPIPQLATGDTFADFQELLGNEIARIFKWMLGIVRSVNSRHS